MTKRPLDRLDLAVVILGLAEVGDHYPFQLLALIFFMNRSFVTDGFERFIRKQDPAVKPAREA